MPKSSVVSLHSSSFTSLQIKLLKLSSHSGQDLNMPLEHEQPYDLELPSVRRGSGGHAQDVNPGR